MKKQVAYLGPAGTYSHYVAEKRLGHKNNFISADSVLDVCKFVARHPAAFGIIPIENSSGGAIYETVDVLLLNSPKIHIMEELALNVRLALLGRPGEKIKILYSHFAPLDHSASWLKKHLPKVIKHPVASTAQAAGKAASEPGAAALGSRRLASSYGLKVLHYPVEADIPNITTFLLITGRRPKAPSQTQNTKMTLSVKLPNVPGSLCTFLDIFREQNVNLSRLISRPIRGCPREYAFLIDLEGHQGIPNVKKALKDARKVSTSLRVAGSYYCRKAYTS